MTWKVRDRDWSVVIMNADGSAGVDAGVRAGADVPFLAPAGWMTGGDLVLLCGCRRAAVPGDPQAAPHWS